ncbi:zinc finger protein 681-like [Diabrotica virgifera virgifera]|uniref:C2H2-type domain-containing protein n=1 Tax=Diabrotica virgifera virgifera TaxID=50390 RepID=A0ABM5JSK4_DIAVI|nr:zinc finger protein 681-like [Diabrotica virgifera virgifera]
MANESAKEWAARLRSLVVSCEFGGAREIEQALVNQFIIGYDSGTVKDRLYEEKSTVKFSEVVEIASAKSVSFSNLQVVKKEPEIHFAESSSKFKQSAHVRASTSQKSNFDAGGRSQSSTAGTSTKTKCLVCGRYHQNENKTEISETLIEHSSYEENSVSSHAGGKTLNPNLKVVMEKKSYNCEICYKQFSQKCALKPHLRIHTGEKPYKCEVCPKQFSQIGCLNRHSKIHTREKPYNCDVCFKQFSQKSNLKEHRKVHTRDAAVHTEEKPYQCEICFKQFSRKSNLKAHSMVHSGEKPYKCEVCYKQFSLADSLKSHLRIHSGENRYKYPTSEDI